MKTEAIKKEEDLSYGQILMILLLLNMIMLAFALIVEYYIKKDLEITKQLLIVSGYLQRGAGIL